MRAIAADIANAGVAASADVKLRSVLNAMGDTDKAAARNRLE